MFYLRRFAWLGAPIFPISDGLGKDLLWAGAPAWRSGYIGLFNCWLDYPIFYPIIVLSGKLVLEVHTQELPAHQ